MPPWRQTNCIRTRGKKGRKHPDPADPLRRRDNKGRGHGTYATDRPPIFAVIGRTSAEVRFFVREHADGATCSAVVASCVAGETGRLYTDESGGYWAIPAKPKLHHGRVQHGAKEWARDDDGDGKREVHCSTCEGVGAGLRTSPRGFRGVRKYYLPDYVAVYETMLNAKTIAAAVLQRMCCGDHVTHSSCA